MAWAATANATPWPVTAFVAAIAVCAIALIWFRIDRRFSVAAIVALMLGDFVLIIAGASRRTPIFGSLLASHLVIGIAMLVVAWIDERHDVVAFWPSILLGAGNGAVARHQRPVASAPVRRRDLRDLHRLSAAPRRAREAIHPAVPRRGARGQSPFFVFARRAIEDAGYGYAIGVLPVFQAALMLLLVWRLLRIEPPSERLLSRLALVAGAALAFITIAIPLQLDKQWITIGWALEGAALVWLYRRIPHRGLLVVVAARCSRRRSCGWPSIPPCSRITRASASRDRELVPLHVPRQRGRLLRRRVAACRRKTPRFKRRASRSLNAGGTVLLFLLVNIEIADFYSTGPTLTFNFFSSSLAQDLTYTIGWALFAVAMLIAGTRAAQPRRRAWRRSSCCSSRC